MALGYTNAINQTPGVNFAYQKRTTQERELLSNLVLGV
jgi:hypothetical protein